MYLHDFWILSGATWDLFLIFISFLRWSNTFQFIFISIEFHQVLGGSLILLFPLPSNSLGSSEDIVCYWVDTSSINQWEHCLQTKPDSFKTTINSLTAFFRLLRHFSFFPSVSLCFLYLLTLHHFTLLI